MAATVGKDGSFKIGANDVEFIDTWSLSPGIGTAEITAFGDSAKGFGSTLREWTGTVGGTLDRSDTDQADLLDQFEDGTIGDIAARFYTANASYWSGNVRLTGQTVNSAVGDKVSVTWNMQGNGALAFTSS